MKNEQDDVIWQSLSKAFFGGQKTTDEGLFTHRVMQEVRRLSPRLADLAWPRFLRWAIPALSVGAISLALAARPLSAIWPDEAVTSVVMEDTE